MEKKEDKTERSSCFHVLDLHYVCINRTDTAADNGKDVMIWTAVEIAAAIIAGSIPILRVFFKETISSHSNSQSKSRSQPRTQTNGSIAEINAQKPQSTADIFLDELQNTTDSASHPHTYGRVHARNHSTGQRTTLSWFDDNDELGILHEDTESDEGVEYVKDAKGKIVLAKGRNPQYQQINQAAKNAPAFV